jgi:hypothetical protein
VTAPAGPERQSDGGTTGAPRPLVERVGLALIALLFGVMFGGIAVASWVGGEVFLAAMGAIGCLMTLWVGALTLRCS